MAQPNRFSGTRTRSLESWIDRCAPQRLAALGFVLVACLVGCGDDAEDTQPGSAVMGPGRAGSGAPAAGGGAPEPMLRDPNAMSGTAGRGPSMPGNPQPPVQDACDMCISENCGGEVRTCNASAPCTQLLRCIVECDQDEACVQACVDMFPEGEPLLAAALTCFDDFCTATCEASPGMNGAGGAGGGPAPGSGDTCDTFQPPGWEGEPVWTNAEAMACIDMCEDDACVAMTCNRGEEALTCVQEEVVECAGRANGPCRLQFSALLCCVEECGDPETCIMGECMDEREAWFACVDSVASQTCAPRAVQFCSSRTP